MTLLAPLGLIGLLGIVALIIIYIIKPNYQQKFISSTFVWKLSLKYRKKRIPTSKLRNIIIIICQILILAISAFILARPSQILKTRATEEEVILVVDSSASMFTKNSDGETRYVRAVGLAEKRTDDVFSRKGTVSVLVADSKPYFLFQRFTEAQSDDAFFELRRLTNDETLCTYGSADMDAAMELCTEITEDNPDAKIVLYTDVDYANAPKGIEVVPVYDRGSEWNAAILNAYAQLDENYYNFYVQIASYGRPSEIGISIDVHGANAESLDDPGIDIPLETVKSVYCREGEVYTVIFRHEFSTIQSYTPTGEEDEDSDVQFMEQIDPRTKAAVKIFSYQSIHISLNVDESDSLRVDDNFDIYGGQKEVIKVQYSSANPNVFTRSALYNLKSYYDRIGKWDFQITEVKRGNEPATEGFDFYVFETAMPEKLPKDGVVVLLDPETAPSGLGVRIENNPYAYFGNGGLRSEPLRSADEEGHPLLNKIVPEDVTISVFRRIGGYDASYKELMYTSTNEPALLLKEDENSKILIMAFSVHYSNIAIRRDYPQLFLNAANYFFPEAVEKNAYEVGEKVKINARGRSVKIGDDGKDITEFPAETQFDMPNTYRIYYTPFFERKADDARKTYVEIFVRVPMAESNVWKVEDGLNTPVKAPDASDFFKDLLLYFAIGLVSFIFIERFLHIFEGA